MLQERNENTGIDITWAGISNGKFVVRANQDDPKAIKRINKLGNEVYERFYDNIYGRIKHIQLETSKFDEEQIKVTLEDEKGEKKVCLTFNYDSSYSRSFMAQVFNLDLSRLVIFTAWQRTTEDDKKISRLYLSYGRNQNVEWKLPEGTPELVWLELKGKKVVDTLSQIKQNEFLTEKLNNFIKENNLTYIPATLDIVEPLTKEEEAELKRMKKQASSVKGSGVSKGDNELDSDDFFASL